MQAPRPANRNLESAIVELRGIFQESQALIASFISGLAEVEGTSSNAEYKTPTENSGHWLTE